MPVSTSTMFLLMEYLAAGEVINGGGASDNDINSNNTVGNNQSDIQTEASLSLYSTTSADWEGGGRQHIGSNESAEVFIVGGSGEMIIYSNATHLDLINNKVIQMTFCLLYAAIFILGVFGNVLVCYVVFRNKAMQTVTNLFITNLALSDILLCILAIPFTPLYTFLHQWIFGTILCHLVPYAQGSSVYISTLTLTSIAIDRFFVIIYPFHPRMKLSTCIIIILSIWGLAFVLTLPYGIYREIYSSDFSGTMRTYCEEDWPSEHYRKVFGSVTSCLQFALPFLIILFCYICVSLRLKDRAKTKPGSKTTRREETDRDRKKRTNRMLIAMVAVFGISWLPLNVVNVLNDFYAKTDEWRFYNFLFFIAHSIAMSSTCYNPFLYAWLNDNFRKEFKQVLPCFNPSRRAPSRNSTGGSMRWQPEQTYNGNNETVQESLLMSRASISQQPFKDTATTTTLTMVGVGTTSNSPSAFCGVEQTILLSEIGTMATRGVGAGGGKNGANHVKINAKAKSQIDGRKAIGPETTILPSGIIETNFEGHFGDNKLPTIQN